MVSIMQDAAAATAREPFGLDYRGTLYGGFMLTPAGPKLVEFNARFGDPETQVVMPRMESDLVDVMLAVAEDRVGRYRPRVVGVLRGVRRLGKRGIPRGLREGQGHPRDRRGRGYRRRHGVPCGHQAFNADEELVTNGGRVLNVVALADTFEEARERAYEACDIINFEGKQLRSDIGRKALAGRSAWE